MPRRHALVPALRQPAEHSTHCRRPRRDPASGPSPVNPARDGDFLPDFAISYEICGLSQLQSWIDQRHGQSRRALSVGLAQLWDWRNPQGQLRDMAVRLLLNRLEQRVGLRLPARQNRGGRRQARPSSQGALTPSGPITQPLGQRQPLSVHLVRPGQAERARLAQYFLAHHYLGYPHPLGQLHYLVTDSQGRDLAVLLFGPAAWKCAPRDLFIGWSAAQRQAHLKQVANNSRYLALHGRRLSRRQLD